MRANARISDEDIARFTSLVGSPPDSVDVPLKPIVTVKISGYEVTINGSPVTLGGGKYVGKMVQNEIAPTDPSWLESDLTDADLGFDTQDDCYVLDYAEAETSAHGLETDQFVTGNVLGVAPDGRYIVAVTSAVGGVASPSAYLVKLTGTESPNALYKGKSLVSAASSGSTPTLTWASTDDCLIRNYLTDTHDLAVDGSVILCGTYMGMTTESTPRKIIGVWAFKPGCP